MKLFGTDGIRGTANIDPITPETITKVAMATSQVLKNGEHNHTVIIGKDTRISGYMIEPALTTGFISAGMNVVLVGPLPTPAVSMLIRSLRADLGVMISASHNPHEDNGIKFFGSDGYKLSHDIESKIEHLIKHNNITKNSNTNNLGKALRLDGAKERYIEYIKNTLPRGVKLNGLKVVIDCANGAAYSIAPQVLWELGAEVIAIGVSPDGFNINKNVGSVHNETMRKTVVDNKADIGIALDGDADRIVISDENGNLIDGDQILALLSKQWKLDNKLASSTIVGTVMSNMGLEKYLDGMGLELARTSVGDKNVCDYMNANNCNIGGEQSGHIILSDFSCTGDGLLTALHVLSVIVQKKIKASQACNVFKPSPQVLRNTKFRGDNPLESLSVQQIIHNIRDKLQANGRVIVRKSGTEPIIRIMLEGNLSKGSLNHYADTIISAIESVR